jgi:hypothetical protein
MSSTTFEAVFMQINALNSTSQPLTLTFHGPIKLMAASSQGAISLLVWVGGHNHSLLIYIFGNLCTSVYQCDCKAWDDDDVGSTSHVTFSHQDVLSLGGTI